MGSQTDLDQGGTYRQTDKVYLGPSVGWVRMPSQWVLPVIAAGTTQIYRGTNLILVSVNADGVILQLPSSLKSAAGAQAIPADFLNYPVTIVDQGGFSLAHPITINPFAGQLISGLPSVQIQSNYGSIVLRPEIDTGGWTMLQ